MVKSQSLSSSYNKAFNPSSSSSSSPSSITTNNNNNMFLQQQLGNSLLTTTTTTTTTTSKTDSENRVIFSDPCSMCGTKKRRVSPIHLNQDYSFSPRKKLFLQSPPSTIQTNSVVSSPILSTSPNSVHSLRRCNSLPSSKSPVSNSFIAKSPPSQPPMVVFSCSSEGSPASASKPPRPPKLFRSISDPLPTPPSSETKILSDEKKWNTFKDYVAIVNELVNGNIQKEEAAAEAEDHKDDNENKQVGENNGEENTEIEGNQVGMINCSCGKRYKLDLALIPV